MCYKNTIPSLCPLPTPFPTYLPAYILTHSLTCLLTYLDSASEMTYIVSSGALNSTHSLTYLEAPVFVSAGDSNAGVVVQ